MSTSHDAIYASPAIRRLREDLALALRAVQHANRLVRASMKCREAHHDAHVMRVHEQQLFHERLGIAARPAGGIEEFHEGHRRLGIAENRRMRTDQRRLLLVHHGPSLAQVRGPPAGARGLSCGASRRRGWAGG